MAEQIPETAYERATQEARDKERLDRQKLLVSLPRGKPEQGVLALMAEKLADLREEQQDALLLLATEDLDTVRDCLVQHLRGLDAKAARFFKIAQVGAKEGTVAAQRVFIPALVYMDLDDEEAKTLEKFRKEQEAAKKKETGKSESSWKMANVKKGVPYRYNYGKAGNSGGYGGGFGSAGGLGGALQKLLEQQMSQGSEGKPKAGRSSAAAVCSSQQDTSMAARMAANRLQYPCNRCGVLGHWKRDDQCKPADVAKYIKKKMAEQAKRDDEEEEGEDTGTNIYSDYLLFVAYDNLTQRIYSDKVGYDILKNLFKNFSSNDWKFLVVLHS
jgi:hypothetical protein